MTTHLIEIDLPGEVTPEFIHLVESFSNAPPDPNVDTEASSGEPDSVGLSYEAVVRSGIIVVRNRTLTTLTKILSPHLPNFPTPPKVTQAGGKGIYDPSGYPVQQLTIHVPVKLTADEDGYTNLGDSRVEKLKTMFDVLYMQLSREGKVSGMRQGEVKIVSRGDEKKNSKYAGQEWRVWSIWITWVSAKERYEQDKSPPKEDERRESLTELVDWEDMCRKMYLWEEKNWAFMSYEKFLEGAKWKCVVM